MPRADEPNLRTHAIRYALLHPEAYLAAALTEFSDDDLAAAIGANPLQVWRLRTYRYPRPDHWSEDVQRLASPIDAKPLELERVLASVGVLP
jgi:hypothetical protein